MENIEEIKNELLSILNTWHDKVIEDAIDEIKEDLENIESCENPKIYTKQIELLGNFTEQYDIPKKTYMLLEKISDIYAMQANEDIYVPVREALDTLQNFANTRGILPCHDPFHLRLMIEKIKENPTQAYMQCAWDNPDAYNLLVFKLISQYLENETQNEC